eukprot:XP_011665618.1 PREDICTED: uncharacterized protein LOC100893904 [Strongylocentrotus purpuratus]
MRLMSASLYVEQFYGSQNSNEHVFEIDTLKINDCQLSTEMTEKLLSCLRSFTSLTQLSITDSSFSFPPSPSKLLSITKLSAERVTSQSYEGLLSSLPGLRDIDITIDDAERDIPQITACLCRTGGQKLTRINLTAPSSLQSEKNIVVSRETVRGLGRLIREQTKDLQRLCLSGMKCLDAEDLVELVDLSSYSKALDSLHFQSLGGECFEYDQESGFRLLSVTKLSAKRVTSQSYEGLLSSLPGLKEIDITIDDAERDVPQITAGLRRTGGQQLTDITLTTLDSFRSEKNRVSRETMRGLGLLIRDQTKKCGQLSLIWVKCTDEEDLVYLIECCRRVKTMSSVW